MMAVYSNQIKSVFSTTNGSPLTNTLRTDSDIGNRLNITNIVNKVINNVPVINNVSPIGILGPKGDKGDPGDDNKIAGHDIQLTTLNNGDLLLFQNGLWVNKNKTSISDGGNF